MTPALLKQVWLLVEETQVTVLLQLDDNSLVHWLMGQVRTNLNLNYREADLVNEYIQAKLPLIRDLAQARLAR